MESEYFGPGDLGLAVAMLDAEGREEREESRAGDRETMAELDRADDAIREAFDRALGEFRDFMRSAGYRQHKRGEWRRPKAGRAAPMSTSTEVATTTTETPEAAPTAKRRVFGRGWRWRPCTP